MRGPEDLDCFTAQLKDAVNLLLLQFHVHPFQLCL